MPVAPIPSQTRCPFVATARIYAGGSLPLAARPSVEAHLLACDDCRDELAACARFVASADVDPALDGLDTRALDVVERKTRPGALALGRRSRSTGDFDP
jgi:hypothetical protein